MQLSNHFSLEEATYSETAIRLGIPNLPSELQLANMKHAAEGMEKVRELTGALRVNSWLRLPDVNVAVGGSKISSHMDGFAIDVSCAAHTPYELCQMVKKANIKFDQMIHEYGRWMQTWAVEPMTNEEVAARTEQEWVAVRNQRHFLLTRSDWTQLPDAPVDAAAWAVHRQALRDITTQSDPFNIVWPAVPSTGS
jgi:hypothetical protein